jgi:hypothetical protein
LKTHQEEDKKCILESEHASLLDGTNAIGASSPGAFSSGSWKITRYVAGD